MEKTFTGLALRESLADQSVLELVSIDKEETWDAPTATGTQPAVWHAVYFTGEASKAKEIAEAFALAIGPGEWYLNFSTEDEVFVVFAGKVFQYHKGDVESRKEAQAHGLSIGIPEAQIEWDEYS